MGQVHITDHPLIQHKVAMLRDENTGSKEFRELVQEIAMLISYEATRDLQLTDMEIQTPVAKTHCRQIYNTKLGIVPILRAGIVMVESMLKLMPTAKVGHIGLYRDPDTLMPIEYYCKLPKDCEDFTIFLLEPMLATGRTASAAIQFIKERNVRNIKLICLIVCQEGIDRITKDHPDVDIYTAAFDKELNDEGYIVPGLGDVGDRLFGTK